MKVETKWANLQNMVIAYTTDSELGIEGGTGQACKEKTINIKSFIPWNCFTSFKEVVFAESFENSVRVEFMTIGSQTVTFGITFEAI